MRFQEAVAIVQIIRFLSLVGDPWIKFPACGFVSDQIQLLWDLGESDGNAFCLFLSLQILINFNEIKNLYQKDHLLK